MPSPPTAPVIIIGAGIAGLALAQGLLKLNSHLPIPNRIPFHIYERSSTFSVRSQGYRLRINDAGTLALKSIFSPSHFHVLKECSPIYTARKGMHPAILDAVTRMETQLPGSASTQRKSEDNEFEPMSADREVLRKVLLKGLENRITYSKDFSHYEILNADSDQGRRRGGVKVKVHFTDGSQVLGSLLVGADGVKSRVRKQLLPGPEHAYIDTEQRYFYGKTPLTAHLLDKLHPHICKEIALVQDRSERYPLSLVVEPIRFKDGKYREEFELPGDYVYWVLGARKEFFETSGSRLSDSELLSLSGEDAMNETRKLTSTWHPGFRVLFELQDPERVAGLRIVSAKPQLPKWEAEGKGRVTLIGDSVHAMAPTAAVGAVTALRSAAGLARCLGEGFTEGMLEEGRLETWEEEMRGFAGEAVERSWFGGKLIFGMKGWEEL
ncbi:FAD/NAD(P)-binding domain-containing protein [Cadophora sp. DSE1049]|nr:FAD/NAD(P)-binding domain-containing protein [Cadophora sp. DSE1049]